MNNFLKSVFDELDTPTKFDPSYATWLLTEALRRVRQAKPRLAHMPFASTHCDVIESHLVLLVGSDAKAPTSIPAKDGVRG